MMISRLRDHLDASGVAHETFSHERGLDTASVAAAAGVPMEQMASSVLVLLDGRPALVIVPAGTVVDPGLLRRACQARVVEFADPLACAAAFPDCEAGAQPALGHLYQLPVIADAALAQQRAIVFNAGTHTQAMRLAWPDFNRLARPRLVTIVEPAATAG